MRAHLSILYCSLHLVLAQLIAVRCESETTTATATTTDEEFASTTTTASSMAPADVSESTHEFNALNVEQSSDDDGVEVDNDANSLQAIAGEKAAALTQQRLSVGRSFRTANNDVYIWPSMSDHEKSVIRDAIFQIQRRTCIRFNELDYKPWYHHSRWQEGRPYVVIRKSKKFIGYSDNKIEDVTQSDKSLNYADKNNSRGMVIDQLLKFMGYREEFLRPDAASYIQPVAGVTRPPPPDPMPQFSAEQLMWPFDPESVTIPSAGRHWYQLTIWCTARTNSNIGAGQRTGLLTRWDAVKLNSMYCPDKVGFADPRLGPCVVPRNNNRQQKHGNK